MGKRDEVGVVGAEALPADMLLLLERPCELAGDAAELFPKVLRKNPLVLRIALDMYCPTKPEVSSSATCQPEALVPHSLFSSSHNLPCPTLPVASCSLSYTCFSGDLVLDA